MRIFYLILLLVNVKAQTEKCHALVLAGGGPRGAFEAGAILALTDLMPPEEVRYRVMSGVSIGAINSCFGLGYSTGDERQMALHIKAAWEDIKGPGDLYTFKPFHIFKQGGLVNTEKLYKYIIKWTGDIVKRNITVAATHYDTGNYSTFDQRFGANYLAKACYASGAYPPFFPPVEVLGEWYGDGAMVANANPFDAIGACRDYGFDDPDIVVDIIYCIPIDGLERQKMNSTKQTINRIDLIQEYFSDNWYTEQMKQLYDRVSFRHFIIPKRDYGALRADPEQINLMMNDGYNQTKEYIMAGPETWKKQRMMNFGMRKFRKQQGV
jgi:predicted acylesterase/phospholipase RssA